MSKYAIAIHGGAGTILKSSMTLSKEAAYNRSLTEAVTEGEEILKRGGSSLDAVEAAIRSLEDNDLFNAGKGSVFTNTGRNELDASIMSGLDLSAGAVAGVTNIRNPITLARSVMEKSEHVLLTGKGAIDFAKTTNQKFENDGYFFVQDRFDQLEEARNAGLVQLDHSDHKFGTVGAVALDLDGNLAAGTSTGGMTNKKFGRVGDSPIIGAGTYANNNTCAVSCTGHGEFFMKTVAAYDVSCLMEYKGLSLKEACKLVVKEKLVKIGGEGGLIAIDAKGNIELVFNSAGMYRAKAGKGKKLFVGIYK